MESKSVVCSAGEGMGLAPHLLRDLSILMCPKGTAGNLWLGGLIPAEYEHLLILSCRRWQSLQACVPDSQEPENKCCLKHHVTDDVGMKFWGVLVFVIVLHWEKMRMVRLK